MIKDGLLDEAMKIMEFKHYNALQTVGYKELFAYLDGKWDFPTAVEEIKRIPEDTLKDNSHGFVKTQTTTSFILVKKTRLLNSLNNTLNNKLHSSSARIVSEKTSFASDSNVFKSLYLAE